MTADQYLNIILTREYVNNGLNSPARGVITTVMPALKRWGGDSLVSVEPSGSFAKGTCNKSGTDIDVFCSLSSSLTNSMQSVYLTLYNQMSSSGYTVKKQNVSLGIHVNGYKVDLVPARRQSPYGSDHSLYRNRANTWTKTNVQTHITTVGGSGRINEIRIVKLWRDQKKIDFPSIYLELTVIEALYGKHAGNLASNVVTVFEYLRDSFQTKRIVDPANSNNIISDELDASGKLAVSNAARAACAASNWNQIVV